MIARFGQRVSLWLCAGEEQKRDESDGEIAGEIRHGNHHV